MIWVAGTIVVMAALAGVVLTFLTLPGIWLAVGVALLCWWWQPGLFDAWEFGVVLAIAVLAEAAEFAASAVGSGRAGGSRHGAVGSLVGSVVGLVVGGVVFSFIPVLGSIVGAVIGAGLGAVAGEVWLSKRSWSDAWRSGRGAAAGRALSIVVKGCFAIAAALALAVSVVWN